MTIKLLRKRTFWSRWKKRDVVIPEKVKEIEDKIKVLKEIRDRKVQEQRDLEEEAERERDWAHINSLIYNKSFAIPSSFPNLALVPSGISKDEIKLWVESMEQEGIFTHIIKESLFETKPTALEMMRGVISQLYRRPIGQVIQSVKLLKNVINRDCEAINKVVQICIDDMVSFWKGRVEKERFEKTVVEIISPSSFQDLKPGVMETWFKLLREQELISPKQHQILTQCLNPKQVIADIMNNVGAISYIKYMKALQKAGGDSTARKLGQENYLQPKPTPPVEVKKKTLVVSEVHLLLNPTLTPHPLMGLHLEVYQKGDSNLEL